MGAHGPQLCPPLDPLASQVQSWRSGCTATPTRVWFCPRPLPLGGSTLRRAVLGMGPRPKLAPNG